MAKSSLQERLREHAKAFDGLLSLIPAKLYYGEDNSDQWQKKKQTKEQAAAAQRAKLDPESVKTAKDVLDERAQKPKRKQLHESEASDVEGVEKEQPRQGLKQPPENQRKKQKTLDSLDGQEAECNIATQLTTPAQEGQKRQRKELKKAKQAASTRTERVKLEKGARQSKQVHSNMEQAVEHAAEVCDSKSLIQRHKERANLEAPPTEDSECLMTSAADDSTLFTHAGIKSTSKPVLDADNLVEEKASKDSDLGSLSSPRSPSPMPIFDNSHLANGISSTSTATSTSSSIPPSKATSIKPPKLPSIPPEILRARLAARIEALRAARKADNPDGTPVRSREELMELRRKKQEQRLKKKRELRLQARQAEEEERERRLERSRASVSIRGSPASFLSGDGERLAFGRVRFGDGSEVKLDGKTIGEGRNTKGPKGGDVAGAMKQHEKKKERFKGIEEEKRNDIEEKEMWSNVKKRVAGQKVKDDEALLKKAIKRKDKAKKKSEKEWAARIEGVEKGKAMRQKKREDNLRKRKEEKGSKGKGRAKKAGGESKKKVKSRPGFEGSFGSGRRK